MEPMWLIGFAFAVFFIPCSCHGFLAYPLSRRGCQDMGCFWFSEPVQIPGEPTLNAAHRTYNSHGSIGGRDWSHKMPWRAPGSAPVFGSGCGSAGGGPIITPIASGSPFLRYQQGADAVKVLPKQNPIVWHQGAVEEVAWRIMANHGGGYSYRLCRSDANISEDCFQQNVLRFAGDLQWIQHGDLWQCGKKLVLPHLEIPLIRTTQGTFPVGSEWARNPIPACSLCDQADCDRLPPDEQLECGASCGGVNLTRCPPGMTQFTEPLPGLSGYGSVHHAEKSLPYSIVDRVEVPRNLEPGPYILSWRWDCEQTAQVFQSCADILLIGSNAEATIKDGVQV